MTCARRPPPGNARRRPGATPVLALIRVPVCFLMRPTGLPGVTGHLPLAIRPVDGESCVSSGHIRVLSALA